MSGGPSEPIAPDQQIFTWKITDKGIYWLNEDDSGIVTLELLDPDSGVSRKVAELNGDDPRASVGSLSITADSRSVAFTRTTRADDDLYYADLDFGPE